MIDFNDMMHPGPYNKLIRYGELVINNYNNIAFDYDVSRIGGKMARQ